MPSVWKYRGDTRWRLASGRSLSGGIDVPCTATGAGVFPPVSGTRSESATDVTPGIAVRRS